MKAVRRFFSLFLIEWTLDMIICVVAMSSLTLTLVISFWIIGTDPFRPRVIEAAYNHTNIYSIIKFLILINILRLIFHIPINMALRSIISIFYFNIFISMIITILTFILVLFFIPPMGFFFFMFSLVASDVPGIFIFLSIFLPFVISPLTAPYVVYFWKGEVFESRINRKFREKLAEKKRTQKHEDIPEQPWWEEGIGPNENLLDVCRKRFRDRSTNSE